MCSKLAGMKQFTTDTAAADLFKKFSAETEEWLRLMTHRNDAEEAARSATTIQKKIQEVEDGNLVVL